MSRKCAGNCGQDAIPGGKYHCHKGEPGYNACKQAALRQRKKADNSGNVTPVTPDFGALQDVISAGFERVVQKMAQSPADALIGTTSRSNDLQQEILDELRKMNAKIDALARRPAVAMQPSFAPAVMPDDDTIELEVTQARSTADNIPGWNLPISVARASGDYSALSPEMRAYGIRTGRIVVKKADDKPSGPKPLAGADVALEAPQQADDLADLIDIN